MKKNSLTKRAMKQLNVMANIVFAMYFGSVSILFLFGWVTESFEYGLGLAFVALMFGLVIIAQPIESISFEYEKLAVRLNGPKKPTLLGSLFKKAINWMCEIDEVVPV